MSLGWAGILVIGAILLVVVAVMVYSVVATQESDSFPAPAVQAFQSQCISAGGDERTCSCLLDEMQQRYTLNELIRLGLQARNTGQIPDELNAALARCEQ
ncbi:MAG: hypothetical protein O2909_06875 [Chloroflexi bacterium]|nr:hypothetical protein [Chloroflexota bacterium]MDA1219146.1 hypothetical protein [Chloroflexota bacterium]